MATNKKPKPQPQLRMVANPTNLRLCTKFASLFLIIDNNIDAVAGFSNVLKYLLHTFYGDDIAKANMVDCGTAFRGMIEKAKALSPLLTKCKKTVDLLYASNNFRPKNGYVFDLEQPIGAVAKARFRPLNMFETIDVLDDFQAYGMLRDGTNPALKNEVFDKNLFGYILQTTLDESTGLDAKALFDIDNKRDMGLCLAVALSMVLVVVTSNAETLSLPEGMQILSKHVRDSITNAQNAENTLLNKLTQSW